MFSINQKTTFLFLNAVSTKLQRLAQLAEEFSLATCIGLNI